MVDKNLGVIGTPDMAATFEGAKRQTMQAINCVQIGEIQAFDTTTQLASIKLTFKQVKDIQEDGTRTLQEYPVLLECPVFFLFGGADFLSMPIAVGDFCIVLFADREIDQWLNHGADQYPVSIRTHDISDAIALVGIRPLTDSLVGYITNGIRLSHGGGNATVDIKTNLIETLATLLLHHGNMQVTGNLTVGGNLTVVGNGSGDAGGTLNIASDVTLSSGHTLTAPIVNSGNGATGTFNVVTVQNGIVTGGS